MNNIAVLAVFVFFVYLAATGRLQNVLLIITQPKVIEVDPNAITAIPKPGAGGAKVPSDTGPVGPAGVTGPTP